MAAKTESEPSPKLFWGAQLAVQCYEWRRFPGLVEWAKWEGTTTRDGRPLQPSQGGGFVPTPHRCCLLFGRRNLSGREVGVAIVIVFHAKQGSRKRRLHLGVSSEEVTLDTVGSED